MHSHYAAMGGFAVDASNERISFLASKKHTQFTLTPEGFLWVARQRPELIPKISQAEILDKSKASALAKTLVCIQAIWFCIQCIVRLSQKLTISLLELNTFAHALCTLVVFGLWWDKPLYIDQPSLLRGQDVEEITTFLLVLSGCNEKFVSATQQEQQFFRIQKDFPKKPTASTTDFGYIETIPNTRASFIYTFSTIRQIIKERDE